MCYCLSLFFSAIYSRKRRLCVLRSKGHYCKRWCIWWKRYDRSTPDVAVQHDGQSGDYGYQCGGQDQWPQDCVGWTNFALISCSGWEYEYRWGYRPDTVSIKNSGWCGLHSKFSRPVCDAPRMLFTTLF